MKHPKLLVLLLISSLLLLVVGCSDSEESSDGDHMDGDDHDSETMGAMMHMHVEAPDEFAGLTNPFAGDHEAIEAGEAIFATNCAICHGIQGKGDGTAATGLDPQPADLSDGTMMHELSDGYLFWRVSEGGAQEPFNSAMPAWESSLSETERWQVISYLRTLSEESGEHIDGDEHMDVSEHADDDHGDN